MLLPIKLICLRDVKKDGTSLIYIQYCHSSEKRTLLSTGIAIPRTYWNKKKECITRELPSEYGIVEQLNQKLNDQVRLIEDLVTLAEKEGAKDKGAFVKQAFKPGLTIEAFKSEMEGVAKEKAERATNLYAQLDDYIASKEKKVSKATLTVFKNVKEHLQYFEHYRKKRITFDSFDYDFYESFVDFLAFEYIQPRRKEKTVGLKLNTIGKTIKQLRIFIKDRVRRKIIVPIDLTDFKIPDEETDAIYLTNEEIEQMYKADLSKYPYLIEYRNLFVLACLTGLRFSDFSTLRPEDLRNNKLHKKQEKSDHWVVIPLRDEAKEIFTEQFKEKLPKLTNAEFNRHIKTIGKIAGICQRITFSYKKGNKTIDVQKPKYDWITTHTARRSFCTNEFLAKTPVKLIMKLSGHKNEKDFYRYIRVTPEEAAMKMEEIWMQRGGNMKAFSATKTE